MVSVEYLVMIFVAGLVTGAACGPSATRLFNELQRRLQVRKRRTIRERQERMTVGGHRA